MTLKDRETKSETMEDSVKEGSGKSLRPVRSKRHARRNFITGHRHQKRLFTPEIKRYLKDWLVRRRENPYPNREEKKKLSQDTGLTYVQICNWFANWRRKLKNTNEDRNQSTWGHLIRTYNDRAHGNVEQFSICSDDSIWSEHDFFHSGSDHIDDGFNEPDSPNSCREDINQNYHEEPFFFNNTQIREPKSEEEPKKISSPMLLSKWLESAARFQPSETNYSWWGEAKRKRPQPKTENVLTSISRHDRDEVEAAVALTALASATI